MSNLNGNPKDWFSFVTALLISGNLGAMAISEIAETGSSQCIVAIQQNLWSQYREYNVPIASQNTDYFGSWNSWA